MMYVIDRGLFDAFIAALIKKGYEVVGPTVRDNAIVYDTLSSCEDLPVGWQDEQGQGTYRLRKRVDKALFGFTVGPHTWKKFLYPSKERLWQVNRNNENFEIAQDPVSPSRFAFLGVRSCELHAIAIQDKIFLEGQHVDSAYQSRREKSLIIAVNCTQTADTCFCPSMKTGPKVSGACDIVLTEVINNEEHYFLAETASVKGEEIVKAVSSTEAGDSRIEAGNTIIQKAEAQIKRTMETQNIDKLLYERQEHPCWEKIARRCLSCANCTMVCPTCFCSAVEDITDLTGGHAERWRVWDSCFTKDFSYIHGGHIRLSTKSRYRQWMTHKLAGWIEQFGTSGCVGCGRCIAWCPVGIDITEQVQKIRE